MAVFELERPGVKQHTNASVAAKIDLYLRRDDTLVAKSLKRFSAPSGESYFNSPQKRALDLLGGVPTAIVATPIIGVLAGMNKALYPSDPAFFHQTRLGHDNAPIHITKIRSMKPHSDYDTTGVTAHVGKTGWENPCNTKFGNFIRKYDLDELPQLRQVVRGEMSLLGVRPLPPAVCQELRTVWSSERLQRWQEIYNQTPLGLSGVKQAFDNGMKEDAKRFHRDAFYANHASLGFDLYLLWRTAARVTKRLK